MTRAEIPEAPRWLQIAGWSGMGKTTIMAALIARAAARGERVMAIKLSDHAQGPDRGDSGRLAAAGAEGVALVGTDRVSWQGRRAALAEWLLAFGGDWVMVEGGRMLPTLKVLVGDVAWPTHRPPVAAGIASIGGPFSAHRALRLPQEAERASAWIDSHRLTFSMPVATWRPLILDVWGRD